MLYLLGQNTDGDFVFVSSSHVSYAVFHPIDMDQFDWEEYARDRLSDEEESYLYILCREYDCRPSELPSYYIDELQDLDMAGNLFDDEINRIYNWRFEAIMSTTDIEIFDFITDEWFDPRMQDESFRNLVIKEKNYSILDAPVADSPECVKWMLEHLPD